MAFILTNIIQKKVSFWNEKVFTEDDLLKLCQLHNARHYENTNMIGKGEYTIHKGQPFVIVNKNLRKEEKLWVGLHELGHHLIHYPVPHKFSKGTKRRMDREANFFAAVALIPTKLIEEKLREEKTIEIALGEIAEEYNYPKELVQIRKEIFIEFLYRI